MKMERNKVTGIAAVMLAAVLLCAGCGAPETMPEEVQEKSMALLLSLEDDFLLDLKKNIEAEAAAQGYELQYYTAEGDPETQLSQAHAALASGVDTLIVNLTTDAASDKVAGIVGGANVVLVNRAPESRGVLHEKMVFVGTDEFQCGMLQGEALAEYFRERRQGTEIRYLLFQGAEGLESTNDRSNGVLQGLMDAGYTPVAAGFQICDFYQEQARTAMAELLEGAVNYDCIICNNDAMALGVIEALEAVGRDPAEIPIVGVDFTENGAAALREGKLLMTVDQNSQEQAKIAVAAAINLDQGQAFNSELDQALAMDRAGREQPYTLRIPVEAMAAR